MTGRVGAFKHFRLGYWHKADIIVAV
jgi:hypothetical protein